jgi:hypothetical protein
MQRSTEKARYLPCLTLISDYLCGNACRMARLIYMLFQGSYDNLVWQIIILCHPKCIAYMYLYYMGSEPKGYFVMDMLK